MVDVKKSTLRKQESAASRCGCIHGCPVSSMPSEPLLLRNLLASALSFSISALLLLTCAPSCVCITVRIVSLSVSQGNVRQDMVCKTSLRAVRFKHSVSVHRHTRVRRCCDAFSLQLLSPCSLHRCSIAFHFFGISGCVEPFAVLC